MKFLTVHPEHFHLANMNRSNNLDALTFESDIPADCSFFTEEALRHALFQRLYVFAYRCLIFTTYLDDYITKMGTCLQYNSIN